MVRILVVTDADEVRDFVVGALQRRGYATFATSDPREVFAMVKEKKPDIVVTDSQVGSMGFTAITRPIKSAERAGEIDPVSVVALLDRAADIFLARRTGADAWLVRPLGLSALRSTIEIIARDPDSWSEEALAAELAGTIAADGSDDIPGSPRQPEHPGTAPDDAAKLLGATRDVAQFG